MAAHLQASLSARHAAGAAVGQQLQAARMVHELLHKWSQAGSTWQVQVGVQGHCNKKQQWPHAHNAQHAPAKDHPEATPDDVCASKLSTCKLCSGLEQAGPACLASGKWQQSATSTRSGLLYS